MKRKESRRRNLQFHLPLMIPLSPNVRMVQDDASYITLQGVFEDYCRRNDLKKDEPILFTIDKLRSIKSVSPRNMAIEVLAPNVLSQSDPQQSNAAQALATRLETFMAVQEKFVPSNLALEYFQSSYPTFDDFWLFRRTFSYQLASLTFMTYIMHMNTRYPHKLSISRGSGKVWGSELIPALAAHKPLFHNPEPIPFRLTPNLQTLMGPLATEGIFAPALMAIARCLVEPEGELELQLSVFVRDEVAFWATQSHKGAATDGQLRENVQQNCDAVVKRANVLAQPPQGSNLPANQQSVDLVSCAVDPRKLGMTDPLWMAYL